ncbi:leukemia-associated protein 7-like [Xyrauchen texanus]|uniref:leukemia-associated protein 7-like n=1 Tax=Xyrauchen texanus TaxID=154827 RepID=UPI002241CF96|nr:leukemia-associated protein 7-like [Xyrauchen texanus]
MGRCSLTHQIDALNILYELRAHSTTSGGEPGQCSDTAAPGTAPVRRTDFTKAPRRLRTIADRARESCFARLVEILTKLIAIEQDFIKGVSNYASSLLRRKDSVDLKNICLRMKLALHEGGSQLDRDLKELGNCLRLIVSNMLSSVRDENNLSFTICTNRLRELSNSFPDI